MSAPPAHTLLVLEDAEAVARDVAARWLAALAQRDASRPFTIALAGGRFPAVLYREFIRLAATGKVSQDASLDHLHFFWGDERCVPPDDPESNFALAARHLFAHLQLAEDCIHRIPVERGESFAVTHAEAELCRVADLNNRGVPVLDLVFLGMGEDGHTASLFHDDPALLSSPAVYRAITGPKPPPRRVTLGMPVLAAAREVWVIATDAGKAKALRASLTGGDTPLAHVLNARTHTGIFTDFELP